MNDLTFDFEKYTIKLARHLDDQKAVDIKLLDLHQVSSYLSYFVIATALSPLHMKKLAKEILDMMKGTELRALQKNRFDFESGWVILDYGGFMVHLFTKEKRDYYRLEDLWKNGKKIDW